MNKSHSYAQHTKDPSNTGRTKKIARLRRNIPISVIAERSGISRTSIWAIKKGRSSVSMGAYAKALHAEDKTIFCYLDDCYHGQNYIENLDTQNSRWREVYSFEWNKDFIKNNGHIFQIRRFIRIF